MKESVCKGCEYEFMPKTICSDDCDKLNEIQWLLIDTVSETNNYVPEETDFNPLDRSRK